MRGLFASIPIALVLAAAASAQIASDTPLTRASAERMSAAETIRHVLGPLSNLYVERAIGGPAGPPCANCSLDSITFYTKPRVVSPGICGASALGVHFEPIAPATRITAKSDTPVRPSEITTRELFLVVGPVEGLSDGEKTEGACNGEHSATRFFGADSESIARDGVRLLNDAVEEAKKSQSLSYSLSCEGVSCDTPRGQLSRMRLVDIGSIRFVECSTPANPGRICFNVDVRDSTNSDGYWRVHITTDSQLRHGPLAVGISHWVYPVI